MISQSSEVDDHQLLERLAGGDMQALAAIYDAYSAVVYHLLLARLADKERAEELLVDVFMALVERGRRVAQIRDLRAYLLQVARNHAAQAHRKHNHDSPDLAIATVADEPVTEALDSIVVREALAELPAEQAEVVVLKVWHELTLAEIGQILDISPNTAASRYRYGLEKLRTILGESYDGK